MQSLVAMRERLPSRRSIVLEVSTQGGNRVHHLLHGGCVRQRLAGDVTQYFKFVRFQALCCWLVGTGQALALFPAMTPAHENRVESIP